ncbi:MAG: glutamine synthetase III [Oligoflexales bacterium]|nr:glutamine synthetase III [Oligoflexales bacterium]
MYTDQSYNPRLSSRTKSTRKHTFGASADSSPDTRMTPNTSGNSVMRSKVSDYFGELTFDMGQMREHLPKEAYEQLIKVLDRKEKLVRNTADAVALAVKDWAVSKGATHYCHWFQPMRGLTAEKHDAFIDIRNTFYSETLVMERFSGSQLIQGEPDASSFPSGGMRSTFEARGYTAWDPTSPIFIMDSENARTLCIPSVFFGYNGWALDNKTHLLRSIEVLSKSATRFFKLLGDVDCKNVETTLGAEQEFFLVDHAHASARPDLVLTGRTLLGAASARGQQLEDHYFGAIPERVKKFMDDLEYELYRLGVPIKTRHNEVAPGQFEMAPIFEFAGIATDHNTLTMELLRKVANRHGFMCLLHEKPFARINGSGKHCNWSLCNDKGENLLDPGKTPHQNLRFLAMLSVVMKAVHAHSDILRTAIASPGNDLRLGGNEAPPAIMSIFLGSQLDGIFASVERGEAVKATKEEIINLGVSHIPTIARDYSDRNRTSPFAFTGNKFEFRAVGGSANVAVPVSVLNAAVSEAFNEASDRLEKKLSSKERDPAVLELIKEMYSEAKNIVFTGNNYSEDWHKEAESKKLPNLKTTADALPMLQSEKATKFLVESGVFSKEELESRYHVFAERYCTTMQLEFTVMMEMVREYAIPAIEKQLLQSRGVLAQSTNKNLAQTYGLHVDKLEDTFAQILTHLNNLETQLKHCDEDMELNKKMRFLAYEVAKLGEKLRNATDTAELMVADELWPLPKYREMLFTNIFS